jgi:3-hydroxyacyl-CoA dehydrogenase
LRHGRPAQTQQDSFQLKEHYMTQYDSGLRSTEQPARGTQSEAVTGDPGAHPVRRHDGRSQHRETRVAPCSPVAVQGDAAGLAANATPPARRVGIMGGGAPGMELARSLLDADIPVTVFDPARDVLDQATAAVRAHYHEAYSAGQLTAAQRDRRVALLAGGINLHHLKDCDVIVDALGTGIEGREALIRRLDEIARPGAVVMTCAPYDDIDRVASLTRCPDNVLGLKASPGANGRRAWQIVPGRTTSAQALATAAGLLRALCKPQDGFNVRPQLEGLQ